jgi:tRNA A-37 threonylcarbamoyl transferase component Bud32
MPARGLARTLRSAGIRLDRTIGHGATCTVHAASDAADRPVVVKVARHPTPATRDALRHEALVLERLRRLDTTAAAGVPEVLRIVDTRGGPALVLRPRGDETLDEWWHTAHELPARDRTLLSVASELVTVLAAIHAEGVVHGDLSPANIVLFGTRPVIVDFASASVDGVRPAGPCGTLPFAAPEVITGAPAGPTTDLYALAGILVELLLGGERARGADHERRAALDACGLGSALVAVLAGALATDPQSRPGHEAWLDALGSTPPTRATTGAPAQPGSRTTSDLSAARTRPFGPRPPARPADPACPRPSWTVTILAGVAGLLVWTALALAAAHAFPEASGAVAAARAVTAPDGPPPTRPPATTPPTATPTAITTTTPPTATPTAITTTTTASTATSAASSPELIRWDPARAEALVTTAGGGVRRYRIGEPGDQVVVGRWACHEATRPAVYRPATGDVFVFSGWADERQALPNATVQRGHPLGGTLRRATHDGCDTITVDPPAAPGRAPPSAAPSE